MQKVLGRVRHALKLFALLRECDLKLTPHLEKAVPPIALCIVDDDSQFKHAPAAGRYKSCCRLGPPFGAVFVWPYANALKTMPLTVGVGQILRVGLSAADWLVIRGWLR